MSERKRRVAEDQGTEQVVEEQAPGTGPAFIATVDQEAPAEVPPGHVLVTYTGDADVVRHGALVFRSGQPVATPSDVAEELLKALADGGEPFVVSTE